MKPRDHQLRGIGQLRDEFAKGQRHGVLVMPTGSGKTALSGFMVQAGLEKGRKALFVADRRVLVYQAAKAFHAMGIPCGIVMRDAGVDWCNRSAPVQIVSKDTLVSWLDRPEFELPPADLVVVDECHKSISESYAVLRAAYPQCWEVGLTATPCRADGKGLGRRYQFLVQPTTYAELQGLNVLMRPECYQPPSASGTQKTKVKRPSKSKLHGDPVQQWRTYADGLRTFTFCSTVGHSIAVRDAYRAAGITAEHIDADTPDEERDRILSSLASGSVRVVTNCAVLRYGVDVPDAECCQILAGMGSIVDYRQSAGRVLRVAPGKTRAVILDHAGAVLYHGFPDSDLPWTLDDSEDHTERQRERMKKGEAPQPIGCPKCGTLYSGMKQCPTCGWQPQRTAAATGTQAGMLTLAERETAKAAMQPEDLQRRWSQLLYGYGRKRGVRVSVVAAAFQKETGRWPNEANVEPCPGYADRGKSVPEWLEEMQGVRPGRT